MTKNNRGEIECNHCGKKWKTQQGSTSNLKKHIMHNHYNKLSETDIESLTTFGQTSGKKGGKKLPQRALIKKNILIMPWLSPGLD